MVTFRLNIGNKKEHIGMPGVKHQIPDPNDAVIKAVAHKIHQKRKVRNIFMHIRVMIFEF